jgi:hypothetical protein
MKYNLLQHVTFFFYSLYKISNKFFVLDQQIKCYTPQKRMKEKNSVCIRVLHGYKFLHPNPNRTGIAIPGLEPDPNTSTRTRTEPDPTDTFKNMINFSNFYFIKNIKNIQRNSTFSSTSMGDESLNHHQIHFDSIFSILIPTQK